VYHSGREERREVGRKRRRVENKRKRVDRKEIKTYKADVIREGKR
jgi:hypothetical protein